MTIIKIIHGDLLEAPEPVLCQQCNCVTILAHGLSEQIVKTFPWADVYGERETLTRNCTSKPSVPGSIQINSREGKSIMNVVVGMIVIHKFPLNQIPVEIV